MPTSCLFVEQLTVIDCTVLDAARGLVGESWIVDLELEGELDRQSMVLDFGEVKKRLKRAIDASADHTLLVPLRSPALRLQRTNARAELEFLTADGPIEHRSPDCALSLVDAAVIDADAVVAHLAPILAAEVPANVAAVRITLRNERIDGAYYHYTHGLKKHAGHCQRIAHGHRSRLEIRVDGARDAALEAAQAERWRDIYLATDEDVLESANGRLRCVYEAPEGRFELALPAARAEVLAVDTTVECLASVIAGQAAAARPGRAIAVRAYEGVMKGARAVR